jgi:two-component system NtrC family response regulator
VAHLLDRGASVSTRGKAFSPAAMERLLAYDFPGNVRELHNLIERASILAAGTVIGPDDLLMPNPSDPGGNAMARWAAGLPEQIDLDEVMARVEEALVARAMEAAVGVQAEAARRLGLSRSVLHYRLERRR